MSLKDRMNDQSNGIEIYKMNNPEDIEKLKLRLKEQKIIPEELIPILGKIEKITDLGESSWYEVIYYDGNSWCSYEGSTTFQDGEHVTSWKYCSEIL